MRDLALQGHSLQDSWWGLAATMTTDGAFISVLPEGELAISSACGPGNPRSSPIPLPRLIGSAQQFHTASRHSERTS
jgi:hypothetical protein